MPMRRNWVLASLMLTMMLAAMDTTIVSTAIPQIVSDLGGFSRLSWVFSIYLLAQTVTIPVYGKLADVFGRKKILITGVCIFLAGSASSAFAWNIYSLIAFRGIQGLGAGSIMATVNTIAGDIYTVKERAKIQGWLSSIWGISAIAGPALGGALTEYISWRWIFLINLPVGMVALSLLMIFFREVVNSKRQIIDYKGAILILATLALVILYIMESGQSWPWVSVPGIGIPAVIVTLGIAGYFVERKAADPILPPWLWKNKTFAFTTLATTGMGVVMMGPDTFLPTFTQSSLETGIIASGFILASMSIGWPFASGYSGNLYLKIGFRNTSLIGAVIIVASCAGFLLIPWPQPVWLIVADQVLLGVGFGLFFTPSLVGVQSMVAWERRGVTTGAVIFGRNLGQSLGAAVFGSIFNISLAHQMRSAPGGISIKPSEVLQTLNTHINSGTKIFLEKAINTATQHIYSGLILFALLTFLFMYMVPKGSKPVKIHEPTGF